MDGTNSSGCEPENEPHRRIHHSGRRSNGKDGLFREDHSTSGLTKSSNPRHSAPSSSIICCAKVVFPDSGRPSIATSRGFGRDARQVVKARILLKADASEAGDAWSDSQIATALDTSIDTVARTRQQLVEEGPEAALTRKHSPASARPRIFDGAAEAKLIALACSKPPKGRARWSLKLLEEAVVELNIVARASDNTIGRTLKKTRSSRTFRSSGSSRRTPTPPS